MMDIAPMLPVHPPADAGESVLGGNQAGVPGSGPLGGMREEGWGAGLSNSSDLTELYLVVAFIAAAGVVMFLCMYCCRRRPKRKKPHRLKTRVHVPSRAMPAGPSWAPVTPRVPSV